ncbi:MAG: hypothetical protein L0Y58_07890 [Verrucomicrobia subdivision 3 bacterium]|nr:hypothetical protein [Limisphaerales bacterium]
MASRAARFNAYLAVALVASVGCGCKSAKEKEASTLRFHLETNPAPVERSVPVAVYRADPIFVNVESAPFLNEGHVKQASVVDALGAFQIMIQFNRKGSWLLEQYTTANKGKRIAIFSQFGQARWLAAPVIVNRIGDGLFVFTPDATREESERIVNGINNVAKVMQKDNP